MFQSRQQIGHYTLIVIPSLILIAVIGFGTYFITNQSKQNDSSKNEITQVPVTQLSNDSANLNSRNVNKPVILNTNANTSTPSATGYNYSGHSNFKTFWADFKKAIISNDRDAVAEMTFIPFRDQFQEVIFNSSGARNL